MWNFESRKGSRASFFKGLIKLAAAGVKIRVNQFRPAKEHLIRSKELIEASKFINTQKLIISIDGLINDLDQINLKEVHLKEYLFTFFIEAYND